MQALLARRSKCTPVLNMRGDLAVTLPDGDDDGDVLTGDMLGNGQAELIVEIERIAESIKVYGWGGRRLDEFMLDMPLRYPVMGDLDGDGRDELLTMEGWDIASYGFKRQKTTIKGWPIGYFPSACADITGDGRGELLACHSPLATGELIDPESGQYLGLAQGARPEEFYAWAGKHAAPAGGFYNPATGEFIELEFPEAAYILNVFTANRGEILVADLDRGNGPEIYLKPLVGTMLLTYNSDGELIYHEEFGAPALDFAAAKGGDGDHLVVQLDDRLLVYP